MIDATERGQAIAPVGRHRATELGRGPLWRSTSVPIRLRRSAASRFLDQLRRARGRQIEANETGKAIWDLCDGVRTLEEIVGTLRDRFDGDAGIIQADVMHAIRIFADAGLLTSSDDCASCVTHSIDLREIPILVINSEDRRDRRTFMQRQMEAFELPFAFANGIKMEGPGRGCAQAHLAVLRRPDLRAPFLVLEDDCELTEGFHYRYVLPQEADALYLGVSAWAVPPGWSGTPYEAAWKGVRFTRFGPNYLRVFNMLGGHARLYLSEAYREAVIEKAAILCARGKRMDAVQASLHLAHVVLTPNELACHQTPTLGGQHRATCRSLLEFIDV